MKDHLVEISKLGLDRAVLIKQSTTTPGSLLYPDSPPDPLGLIAVPMAMRIYDLPHHYLVDLNIKHRIRGQKLLDMLTTTRRIYDPNKPIAKQQEQDINGAWDDLNELTPIVAGDDIDLLANHQRSFGSLWTELYSGEHLMYAESFSGLGAEDANETLTEDLRTLRSKDTVINKFGGAFRDGYINSTYILNRLLNMPETSSQLNAWIKANEPEVMNKDCMHWSEHAKARFMRDFVFPLGSNPEMITTLIDQEVFTLDLKIIDTNQPKGHSIDLAWTGDGIDHRAVHLGDNRVKIVHANSHMIVELKDGGNRELYRSIDVQTEKDLKPRFIAARKKGGSKEWIYVSSGIPEPLKTDWSVGTTTNLGLMFALHYSADARAKLPESMKFKPKKPEEKTPDEPEYDTQVMGEVQNLMVASMMREEIMNGAFVRKGLDPHLDFLGLV